MTSGSWYKGILLTAVLLCILHEATTDCSDESENQGCDQCYQTLSSFLVNTSNNKYYLRKAFFPPDAIPPVFVTVTYQYDNMSIPNQIWYWSVGSFYFYQPLRVFQFTSLFFGHPDLLRGAVTITLPAQCENAPEDFMQQLTQMLKLYASWQSANPRIDDTYQAKAASLNTLQRDIYPQQYFVVNMPLLLYSFQILFPTFTIALISVCICCERNYVEKHAKNADSWATISAYAFVCVEAVLWIFALDITALVFQYRDLNTTEYLNTGYNEIHNYPIPVILFDSIALLVIVLVPVIFKVKGRCSGTPEQKKKRFFILTLAGVPSLLCLTSHTHYVLIAWLIQPSYATSIGIYYSITIFLHFFLLKQSYKQAVIRSKRATSCKPCSLVCIPAFAMLVVYIITLGLQALFTVFFVIIPINHSIRDTPNTVYTILHGIEVLLLALVAYKVILDPKGSFSIGGGVQIALARLKSRKDGTSGLYKREWEDLFDEQKLAEVLFAIHRQKIEKYYELQEQQPSDSNPSNSNPSSSNPSSSNSSSSNLSSSNLSNSNPNCSSYNLLPNETIN